MKRDQWIFFVLGWLGMVLYFTQRWIYGPLIPSIMTEFGLDKTSAGLIGSASLWGYMITPIAAGLLSDRYSRKFTTLGGIFGFSLLTLLCGLSTGTGQLFAARFLGGVGEAFFFVPLMAFTLELYPERPGLSLTLMSSGSSLGWFTGPALAGWLVGLSGNWRLPFWVAGAAGLAVASLMYLTWPNIEGTVRSGPFFDRDILKRPNLILLFFLSLVAAFNISAEFGFTMWLPSFLELEVGMTAAAAGFIAGLYGVGQFLGRPVLGWVSDRFGYRPVGILGAIVLGSSLILVLGVDARGPRALFTFQAGFIGAAVMGALWTFTGLVFVSFKGLALGVITTFGYVAASLSPILIGYMADHHSVAEGLWRISVPASFLAGLSFAFTFWLKSPLGRGAAGPSGSRGNRTG